MKAVYPFLVYEKNHIIQNKNSVFLASLVDKKTELSTEQEKIPKTEGNTYYC